MLTNGAVVVIKRGDTAMADMLEQAYKPVGKHVKKTTVQDIKNLERDYNIMYVSHHEKIKKAMAESKVKYRHRTRQTPKPLLYLMIGEAIVVYWLDTAWKAVRMAIRKFAKKTKRIVKILGRSKYNTRRV